MFSIPQKLSLRRQRSDEGSDDSTPEQEASTHRRNSSAKAERRGRSASPKRRSRSASPSKRSRRYLEQDVDNSNHNSLHRRTAKLKQWMKRSNSDGSLSDLPLSADRRGRSASPRRRSRRSKATSPSRKGDGTNNNSSRRDRIRLRQRMMEASQKRSSTGNLNTVPQRRVKFSKEEPVIAYTLSLQDFSNIEIDSYWIHSDEMDRCIDRNWDIVDAYEKHKVLKSPPAEPESPVRRDFKLCTRGLESYIIERKSGKAEHRIKRKNAYTAVLLWGRGLSDEERSRRYQTVSKRCTNRAIEYGRRDALVATRILTEDLTAGVHQIHRSQSQSDMMPSKRDKEAAVLGTPKQSRKSTSAIPGARGAANKQKTSGGPKRASSLSWDTLVSSVFRSSQEIATSQPPSPLILKTPSSSKVGSPSKRAKSPRRSSRRVSKEGAENRRKPVSDIPSPPMLEEEEVNDDLFHGQVAQIEDSPKAAASAKAKVMGEHPFASPVITPSAKALKSNKLIFSMLRKE